MTVLFVDGFDQYSNFTSAPPGIYGSWLAYGAFNAQTSMDVGRFDTGPAPYVIYCGFQRFIGANLTSMSIGAAIKVGAAATAVTNPNAMGVLDSAGNPQIGVKIDSLGNIVLYRGSTVVLAQTFDAPCRYLTWHYLECEFFIDDTTGTAKVYLNGKKVIDYTGDTRATAVVGANFVHIGGNLYGAIVFDDFYVTDTAARLGELRVDTLRPDGDSTALNWTPSTSTVHYTMVNEVAANADTNYVQGPSVGFIDMYTVANLATTPANVVAVQIMSASRKTDAAVREIAHKIRSGATTVNGASKALTASYIYYSDIWPLNPATSAAWTYTDVNSMEIGLEVIT